MAEDARRRRQRDRLISIVMSAATGGYLLAWWGAPWTFVGMGLGVLVGYLVNRQRRPSTADGKQGGEEG